MQKTPDRIAATGASVDYVWTSVHYEHLVTQRTVPLVVAPTPVTVGSDFTKQIAKRNEHKEYGENDPYLRLNRRREQAWYQVCEPPQKCETQPSDYDVDKESNE
jgi:hypothetical protein